MYKIYINDRQVDTYNLDNIIINELLFDISNPANRGVGFSNKIILPKTANNIETFEFYDEKDQLMQSLNPFEHKIGNIHNKIMYRRSLYWKK